MLVEWLVRKPGQDTQLRTYSASNSEGGGMLALLQRCPYGFGLGGKPSDAPLARRCVSMRSTTAQTAQGRQARGGELEVIPSMSWVKYW